MKQYSHEHPTDGQKAAATIGGKATEEQREMEADTSLETIHDINSRRTSTAEAEVIAGPPNTKLTDVEKVHKDTRDDTKFVAREAKQDMTNLGAVSRKTR